MELWIRSQSQRNLMKAEDIVVNANKIEIYKQNEDSTIVGEYKAEERALEVLDEIQKQLIGKKGLITTLDKKGIEFIPFENQVIVYQMPKE